MGEIIPFSAQFQEKAVLLQYRAQRLIIRIWFGYQMVQLYIASHRVVPSLRKILVAGSVQDVRGYPS